jgi:hypothetical protein
MSALRCEKDDYGIQKTNEGKRADKANEPILVFLWAEKRAQGKSGQNCGSKRNSEKNGNAGGDSAIADGQVVVRMTDHLDVEDGEGRKENDLEDGIKGDQYCAVVWITIGQIVPDENHCDTPGDTDEDEALSKILTIRKEGPRKGDHEKRRNDPVENKRDSDLNPKLPITKKNMQGLVADLAENRIHHDQKANG